MVSFGHGYGLRTFRVICNAFDGYISFFFLHRIKMLQKRQGGPCPATGHINLTIDLVCIWCLMADICP